MCASTHWIASASAQAVLERGGNAFDAAVAGAFVLHVVEPHLNGPGGDMTAVFATADDPRPTVLVGQGPAPAGATIEHFRAEGLDLVPGAGALAAAVPGCGRRLAAAAARPRHVGAGRRPRPSPSGTPRKGTRSRSGCAPCSTPCATSSPTTGRLGRHLAARRRGPGARARRAPEEYAATLRRLVEARPPARSREERIDAARGEWGSGFVAEAVEAFVRSPHRHSSGADHAGVITAADMAAFSARPTSRRPRWTSAG